MIFLFVSIEYSRREFIIILKKNINVKLHVNKATISISREKKKHKRKRKYNHFSIMEPLTKHINNTKRVFNFSGRFRAQFNDLLT